MIVNLNEVLKEEELKNISEEKLKRKLKAIEIAIRKHTNNKFLDTKFRFYGPIKDGKLYIPTMFFKLNDNIEISHSLNDGPHTITEISKEYISVDDQLYDCSKVMITKIVYPADIQEGVIDMLKWDFGLRKKVGIKSETLSRHSVTYFDMDKNNSLKGYPASLLGFLEDYVKVRF